MPIHVKAFTHSLAGVMCTTTFLFQKELILEKISSPKRDFPDFVDDNFAIGRFDIVNYNLHNFCLGNLINLIISWNHGGIYTCFGEKSQNVLPKTYFKTVKYF